MAICTVTGTISKVDGSPAANQQVVVVVKSTQIDQGGQLAGGIGVISDPLEAFTDDGGVFSIDLLQGATVTLEVPGINLRKEIIVPASTTVDFSTLI